MAKGLSKVMGAVSAKAPIPSLSNLHLKLNGSMLEVTGTDLDLTITAKVELVESEGEGGILVHARRFQDIIRELPDVVLEMTVEDETRVLLKGNGIGIYTIPAGNVADFPEIPSVDPQFSFGLSNDVLRRVITKAIFAVSHDEMRPILTGLLFQLRPDELRVVATDGHRLSRIIRNDISYQGDSRDVTIPMKSLSTLMKNLSDEDDLQIGIAQSRAAFTTNSHNLITRLIDGNYPKYEGVIPQSNPGRLTVRVDEMMAAVRRVQIFASQMSKQLKLEIQSDKVVVQAEDPDTGGRAEESIACEYTGNPLEIAYNAGYLTDILKQIDTEEAHFEMATSNDGAVIKPTSQMDGEDFLMLLMPIRLR